MRKKVLALGLIVSLVSSAWGMSNYVVAETSENQVYEVERSAGKEIEEPELTADEIPDALGITENEKKDITDKYTKRLYNEERNLNTVMFENEDGERTMYMFKHPVKFEDENGNIVDKDVHFEELGDECGIRIKKRYICDNGDNDVKVYMPNSITYGINIETDENSIEMAVNENYNKDTEVMVEDNYVIYDEVFGDGTSIKYTPLLNGIKEEIILEEFTGQTEFDFTLRLDGYELVTLDDNCLYLENVESGEIEGIIDSVYMIDANGETNFNNYYTYEELAEGYYKITAHVNEEFLTNENTAYPVTIDPTITLEKAKSTTAILDATLNSTSTTAGTSGSLFVGNRSNTENGISRAVMKFPGLDFDELKVSVVLEAKVSIRDLMCESTALNIGCFPLLGVNENWNESNVSWDYLNMGSNPLTIIGSDTNMVSYSNGIAQTDAHRYEFVITEAVRRWRTGTSSLTKDQGVVFKATTETNVISKTFGSYNRASNNPVFEMKYVPYGGGWSYDLFNSKVERYTQNGLSQLYYKPNCVGLTLYSNLIVDAETLGIVSERDRVNVELVAGKIVDYAKDNRYLPHITDIRYIKCGLDDVNYVLAANQYLIAVRGGIGTDNVLDFHAIVQTNQGYWIDKHGAQQTVNILGYINPDDDEAICWKSDEYKDDINGNENTGYCYTTDTAYIIVTTNQQLN